MKLSIIIPIYNSASFIGHCLDSILTQKNSDIEIILVDDGSIDASLQICKEYAIKDNRICVLHQFNQGVNVARQKGYDIANGEYLMFVDSDDILPENAIEKLMDYAMQGFDVVRGNYCIVNSKGEETKQNSAIGYYTGEEYSNLLQKGQTPPFLWGGVYRKKVIDRSFFDYVIEYDLRIGEDYVMNLFISMNVVKVKLISDVVYLYIQNEGSVMHQKVFGREYASRIDDCITKYYKFPSEFSKKLFELNQIKGAISREFVPEMPFSYSDYKRIKKYISNKKNENIIREYHNRKQLLFIKYFVLFFIYTRIFCFLYVHLKSNYFKRDII